MLMVWYSSETPTVALVRRDKAFFHRSADEGVGSVKLSLLEF